MQQVIIDADITRVTAAKIEPYNIPNQFPDVGYQTAIALGIWIMFDDLKTKADLKCTLCNVEKNIVIFDDVMDGENYTNWKGDNNYPFIYISNKYGITLATNQGQ